MGARTLPLCVLLAIGCVGISRRVDGPGGAGKRGPEKVSSNVLRADYAGSAECQVCHEALYSSWEASPMRNMTRLIDGARVMAPFNGGTFELRGDRATMFERGGALMMTIASEHADRAGTFRLTRVIGGRHREDFAGVDERGGEEKVLPVSYVFSTGTWRYKGYSVMLPERPGLKAGPVWRQTCILCHNTAPALVTLYDDLAAPAAAKAGYQGSVTDHLLPPERRWVTAALDPVRLGTALRDEVARLQAPPKDASSDLGSQVRVAINSTRRHFDEQHLVEVGIGCEACHNGSREHMENPNVLPTFELRSPLLRVGPPEDRAPSRAASINRTCARCHTVLFSGYPHTWEGGRRSDPVPGGSNINSGEARDFLLGGCADAMSCTSCHDPHTRGSEASLAALATPAGNAICTNCHGELTQPAALRAHSAHDPAGAGGSCVGCHMPRKNLALDSRLTRYHRIGSPTDEARVLRDRPLECALCHADRTVESLVADMERIWNKRYDRQALRELYGSLDSPVLAATLQRGKPHEQAVAAAVLGESHPGGEAGRGAEATVSLLVPELTNEIPLVRWYVLRAVERVVGTPVPVDVGAPRADVERQVEAWRTSRHQAEDRAP